MTLINHVARCLLHARVPPLLPWKESSSAFLEGSDGGGGVLSSYMPAINSGRLLASPNCLVSSGVAQVISWRRTAYVLP